MSDGRDLRGRVQLRLRHLHVPYRRPGRHRERRPNLQRARTRRGPTGHLPRAYLATSTESPEERLGSSSGWLRPDRRPFVYSRDDLVSSLIRFPLLLDEHGRLSEHVGQGLRIGSTHQNCLDWTSADTSHRVPGGYVGLTVRWNEGALGQCHTEEPLYCFGIDHDAPIPPVSVGGRLAFLTRGAVSPDEGRDAADRLCADEAAAAGLPG